MKIATRRLIKGSQYTWIVILLPTPPEAASGSVQIIEFKKKPLLNMRKLFLLTLQILAYYSYCQNISLLDHKQYFNNLTGGFVIYNFSDQTLYVANQEFCNKRLSPCSTFKIPHSLIAIENGIVPDTGFIIPYDSIANPKEEELMSATPFSHWFEDLSLAQAFRYSCVWYFQEVAKRIGQEQLQQKLNTLDYGNKNIQSGVDNFWLSGSLEITVKEQMDFLIRLYNDDLEEFSTRTVEMVKTIMLMETGKNYKLYGKTGGCENPEGNVTGWFVGFIETSDNSLVFAMSIVVNDYSAFRNNFRIELMKSILKKLNIINI